MFWNGHPTDVALNGYLTDVYNKSKATMERNYHTAFSGWAEIHRKIDYHIGKDQYFAKCGYPEIAYEDISSVFSHGISFLSVGKQPTQIRVLWLYAHLGYMLYWLRRATNDLSMFVLYLRGQTGSLKTSVTKVLGNVFDQNRNHATTRMTSTVASIREFLSTGRDCVKVIDDFSNSSALDANNAERNAEVIIRAVGDGILPSKMDPASNFSKI